MCCAESEKSRGVEFGMTGMVSKAAVAARSKNGLSMPKSKLANMSS